MPNLDFAVGRDAKDGRAITTFLHDHARWLRGSGMQVRGEVNPTIDARDEMYAFALANCPSKSMATLGYFRSGAQIQATVRQVYDWYFSGRREPKVILDFASGYGRATRFMVDEFPEDVVWASDILEGAMEFQSRELGINTIISTTRPADFKPEKSFDLIWVNSLFTHLPKGSFDEWLVKLHGLLAPGGLLAFTVHDTHQLPAGASMPPDGFFFQPLTEIPTLDTADYGATIVTEDFVSGAIRRCTGKRKYLKFPRAISFHQDLYLLPQSDLPARDLSIMHTPYGCLDACIWKRNNALFMKGWALDFNVGHDIEKIEIFLNGELIATPSRSLDRPDIVEHAREFVGDRASKFLQSGWSVEVAIQRPLQPHSDVLLAKATSTTGLEFLLRCGTLSTMLTFHS